MILSGYLKTVEIPVDNQRLGVFLFLGVNGVGKTTTIAKTADYYRGKVGTDSIVFAAGDTFRAAAGEQLSILGERLGIRVVKQQPGSDPGSVIYDSIESTRSRGGGLVLADTAGRMHTKNNLVRELGKIDKIISNKIEDGYYWKLLVIDATTGQNALRQAEIFHEAVGVDAVVMAKFDSSAKGGIAVSICKELGLPFAFAGTGEKLDRLRRFESGWFLDEFLGVS
jgi:fused signal recognition particle receptor